MNLYAPSPRIFRANEDFRSSLLFFGIGLAISSRIFAMFLSSGSVEVSEYAFSYPFRNPYSWSCGASFAVVSYESVFENALAVFPLLSIVVPDSNVEFAGIGFIFNFLKSKSGGGVFVLSKSSMSFSYMSLMKMFISSLTFGFSPVFQSLLIVSVNCSVYLFLT